VAPNWLRDQLFLLIEAEIEKAKAGLPCGVLIKMNSLTDRNTIDKLSEASQAGVPVRLIIRGICCLIPGVPGKTENITVRSIIGRFLEHSRVYCFGHRDDMRMYISSADLMTRNVERRIEAACPVFDPEIKRRLLHILDIQLLDAGRAWILNPDGSYSLQEDGETTFHCQDYFMHEAMMERFAQPPPAAEKKKGWFSSLWARIFKRPPRD
jgi:polyphosphate kinase